ncbi:MAG: response regulator, partial [Acetatifactor sp.]|nr:response regulator [Acetatifactor sp.]
MKHRIQIIEDDIVIQTQLSNLLTGNGYETETINDFPVDMEQVKSFQPHLILLDIKLPGNDGFSVCSQIRTFSNVPIIFVTSCNTDMDELNSIM